jgi:hypothetical protein
MNDPVYLEAAQALAIRMLQADHTDEQIKQGYRLAMVKEIDPIKFEQLKQLYLESFDSFEEDPKAAEKLTGIKDLKLAALTVIANVILNLDEVITKS